MKNLKLKSSPSLAQMRKRPAAWAHISVLDARLRITYPDGLVEWFLWDQYAWRKSWKTHEDIRRECLFVGWL